MGPRFTACLIRGLAASLIATAALASTGCGPKYPNCNNDEDCHEGEFCVNGRCQLCRTDADCPTGQQCVDGRCDPIPGYCQGDGDCPAGQECRDNRCVAAAQQTVDTGPEPTSTTPQCSLSAVYFGFDSENISEESRSGIQRNAQCIRERRIAAVHLTGHCDPRGTEEYNLALGDRRARSVQTYLQTLSTGATITVSSMGEEMATGTGDSSWARDRRVDFIER
jgi:peptidoglycan-associated lipoprotein